MEELSSKNAANVLSQLKERRRETGVEGGEKGADEGRG